MLLTNRYQEHIYFFNEPGQEIVVYFKEMTDYLINEKYREKKTTVQEVSKRIQTLAANLIKPEIRRFGRDLALNDFLDSHQGLVCQ